MTVQAPVLCGYDGSPAARNAVDWAGREARVRGTWLQVVTAVDLGGRLLTPNLPPAAWPGDDTVLLAARRDAEQVAVEVSRTTGCRAEAVTAVDSPARLLRSMSSGAPVLVLGARGRGGFSRLLLGSVSETVAEHAACPVVVVRPRSELPDAEYAGAVLLGIDGSPNGADAARFAFEFADRRHLELVALYAQPVDPLLSGLVPIQPPRSTAEPTTEVLALLHKAVERGQRAHPDVAVKSVAFSGQPVEVLVTLSTGAALLVVGSRGRNTLTAALLGSVSRGVLRHATCSVAVVPCAS